MMLVLQRVQPMMFGLKFVVNIMEKPSLLKAGLLKVASVLLKYVLLVKVFVLQKEL